MSVLMVCRHNICRSPLAEGLFRHHLQRKGLARMIRVRSAGTHVSGFGQRVDMRAQKVAGEAGVKLKRNRSKAVREKDFARYDYIFAMDRDNLKDLMASCPQEVSVRKLSLVSDGYGQGLPEDIPDPYYGGIGGFREVFSRLDGVTSALVDRLAVELPLL